MSDKTKKQDPTEHESLNQEQAEHYIYRGRAEQPPVENESSDDEAEEGLRHLQDEDNSYIKVKSLIFDHKLLSMCFASFTGLSLGITLAFLMMLGFFDPISKLIKTFYHFKK